MGKTLIELSVSRHTGVSTFASCTSPSTDQSLQKSFHLSLPDKIEFKKISSPSENKKYPTAQTDTTMTQKHNNDNGLQTRWTRTPAGNSVFATMAGDVGKQTVVQLINFCAGRQICAPKPPQRKYANRYMPF